MLVAFDAGNTNIKAALFDGERIACRWRLATDTRLTEDDYGAELLRLADADGISAADVTGAAIASVVPDLTPSLTGACERYLGAKPFVVDGSARFPVESEYDRALGVDRMMGVVAAAHHHGPAPLVVVDLGTAVKFDAIDARGVHAGGAIAPGIGIAADELFNRVAQVARSIVVAPSGVVGRNNAQAVSSGVVLGYAGMIDGMVARFREELGGPARVVATGGWAPTLATACHFDVVDADLTVKGVRLVYELNRA
jgi:type III pantothenate kinase